MQARPLNAGEKAELDIIERRMNHLTVAAGSLGMILYSIVDYFLAPALWQEFLFMRIGFTLYGSCIMIVTMIRKVGNQGGLYLFWIPVFVFAAFGASRFDSGQGLLSWNMHLCIIILFIANVAVTPFRLMTIFSALSLLFYLGFLVFGSKLDFIDALVHGAALFCIGLILAPFLSMARYRTVTDNVRMRHRITLQNEELRGLNAGKDRFFSIIAHDLRGPIGSTIRLMENILDEENPDCKSDLHLILESMNRIYSLLETLLLWARSQKGELSLVPVRLKVAEVITRAFNDVTQAVAEKKIVIDIKADQSAHVFADENMLHTILRNLLSNAVKYTRAGGRVTVSSERHDGRLIIKV